MVVEKKAEDEISVEKIARLGAHDFDLIPTSRPMARSIPLVSAAIDVNFLPGRREPKAEAVPEIG
jgi:hypothetical protein